MLPEELPHTCEIHESIWTPDEFAADYDDPEAVETDRACWVQEASDREINQFQRRDQVVTHSVYFQGDPGLEPGFYVYPTSGPQAGKWLEVVSSAECTAGLGVLWRATCRLNAAR